MTNPIPNDPALVLTAPAPSSTASGEQTAKDALHVDPIVKEQIDTIVDRYVRALLSAAPHSPAFDQQVTAVRTMGDADIRASAAVSNRLLERPAGSISSGAFDAKSNLSTSLVKLRRTVEDLDPTQQGMLGKKRLWGGLPFGNSMRDYFHRYESSQANLDAIIQSLYAGQDELAKDNAALEQEKANAWAIKARLEQYIYMATALDEQVSARIAAIASTDPQRARSLQEDLLFDIRQKRQDLLTQLAVNAQGYLAMDLVERNNQELIKGVDRATTTTVSALRTAIIVAQALNNQKLVLNQIDALNTTTSNLIESTSDMLKRQSGQVYQQAASSTIELEKLQKAFDNIYSSLDALDTYRTQALESMRKTIDALSTEIGKADAYLQRAHASPPALESPISSLKVPAEKSH